MSIREPSNSSKTLICLQIYTCNLWSRVQALLLVPAAKIWTDRNSLDQINALCLMYVAFVIRRSPDGRRLPLFPIIFLSVATAVVVLDVGFNGVLLRGCHKKDSVLLRLFYRYSIFLLGLNIAFVLANIIMNIVINVHAPSSWILSFFVFLMFCVLSIIIHLYLSILVRSEAQKLEATTQFQFTNIAAEAACTMDPGCTGIHPATNRPNNV